MLPIEVVIFLLLWAMLAAFVFGYFAGKAQAKENLKNYGEI